MTASHVTNQRPRAVTVISWIFIAFCGMALVMSLLPPADTAAGRSIAEFRSQHPLQYALKYIGPGLGVICGVFLLRGCNWARWLLVVWMGFHIVIGFLHSLFGSVVHSLLFAALVWFLFCRPATAYFRGTPVEPTQTPKTDDTQANA